MNSLHRVFFKNFSFFKTYTINIILNIYDLCVSLYISFFKYKYDIFVKKSLSIKFKNLFNIQEGCVDLSLIKIVFGKIINKTLFKSLIWGNRVPNGSDYKHGFVVFYKHYTQFIYECLVGVVLYEWVYAVLIEDILHIKTHILERSFNIFYFFNKFFFHSLVSFYKFLRNLIIPLFLSLLVTILLINFYAVNIVRQVGVWVVVGGIFFWLISGFNFFIKRYRFGKFTSSIQRFWKRANSYFWLVEGFLFSLFFYYYLNSSQEPIYMYDESALNQTSLFSLYNFFFSYLLLVFIIFYSLYLLLNIVNFNSKQLIFHLTVNSLLILVIYLLESYQFYFVITTFIENNWVFSGVENWWSLEIETTKTRVKYQYLLLALIAKYWHFLFIFLSWLFFVFKSYEQKRVYYPFLGVNIQNFILLFGLNSLFYFQWVKWVVRRYLDGLYYWFFIDSNNWSLYNIFTIVYNFF